MRSQSRQDARFREIIERKPGGFELDDRRWLAGAAALTRGSPLHETMRSRYHPPLLGSDNRSRPPYSFLCPIKMAELDGSERCFCDRKELVELRGFDACSGKHGVCLPTMVDLMLKEMHEEAIAPFRLYLRFTIDPHDTVKEIRRQRIADCDQTFVDGSLSRLQFGKRRTWNGVLPGFWPEPPT